MSGPRQAALMASAGPVLTSPSRSVTPSWRSWVIRTLLETVFRFYRWIYLLVGGSRVPYRSWQAAVASRNAYKATQNPNALKDAISYYRAARAIHAHDASEHTISIQLACSLQDKYCRFGDDQDLHEAVVVARQALRGTCRDGDDSTTARLALAEILRIRYLRTQDMVDLEEAVHLLRRTENSCSSDQVCRCEMLTLLACALQDRYQRFCTRDDLEQALVLLRETVKFRCADHSHRTAALQSLASALRHHVFAGAPLTELDEAISACHMALEVQLPTEHRRADTLTTLGACLHARYQRTGIASALTDSIASHREALALRPKGHPLRDQSLTSLGGALYLRCGQTGVQADLDEGIGCLREASLLPATSRSPDIYIHTLLNLATALRLRFISVSGATADLDECIELRQRAVALCPASPRMRGPVLASLADGLCVRYEVLGSLTDLTEALSLMRTALSEQAPGDSFRSHTGGLLGHALVVLSETQKMLPGVQRLESLDEAISLLRKTNKAELEGSFLKSSLLSGLGHALLSRYDRFFDAADLTEAVSCHIEQLKMEPEDSRQYHDALTSYARSLTKRFRAYSSEDDASDALIHLKSALVRLPNGTIERPLCLVQLSQLYLENETPFHDKSIAFSYLIESLDYAYGSAQTRLSGALKVLERTRDFSYQEICSDLSLLCDAYVKVVQLLPRVAFFGLDPTSRLATLAKAEGIAMEGAAHALLVNRADLAVELLEQGRSLFWSQTLRLRTSFDEVPEVLKERAFSLVRLLELESVSSSETNMTERRHRSELFDALLKDIRALPSFSQFMLPEEYSSLAHVASEGPVVVLIGADRGCFALIMQSPNSVTALPLKEVGWPWLKDATESWRVATEAARSYESEANQSRLKMDKIRPRRHQHLHIRHRPDAILREMWERIVHPVFEELRITPTPGRSRPRLWWCATGMFTFLPMHAAGIYPDGPCTSDYVVSSYTPTLSALLDARRRHQPLMPRQAQVIIAGVSASENKGWRPLPFTVKEANVIKTITPPHCLRPLPPEDDLLSGVPNAGMSAQRLLTEFYMNDSVLVLHFACHGSQNIENPLQSGFVMRDEVLTISRLLPVPLSNAFFAFLSACETAKGHQEQPDQTVHLAATMLFVGFKSVVATLWNMDDCDGPLVANKIYGNLFRSDAQYLNPEVIPYALDEAAQELRRNGASPSRWAPYIHIGI